MTSGWLFLGVSTLICAAAFHVGRRFARMTDAQVATRGIQVEAPAWLIRRRTPGQTVRLFGRVMMIAAPLFLLFFTALSFGLFGPVDGIHTIQLLSE